MSFEVYLQCFQNGKPAGVPRLLIRPLFPVLEDESGPDDWKVWYNEENWCNISVNFLASDSSLVEGLCVYRPCGDGRFWEAILQVMRLGPITLYWPGDAPPLVANESAGNQLPPDMVDRLGAPRVVRTTTEILEIIKDS